MAELLRKVQNKQLENGVTLLQEVTESNSGLKYVGFKAFELETNASIKEELTGLECCIVALTGRITVSDGEQTFEEIGRRESVFEKVPTDSVYVSNGRTVEVTANTPARIALCYAPSDKQLPTKLMMASSPAFC